MTRTMTFVFAAIVSSSLTNSATAASYHHIDELALRIQKQSAKLFVEFRHHYSHTPEFQHLISDARQLHRLAKHIHEIAHHRGSLIHLKSDLRELDQSFHHLEEVVEGIERDARCRHSGHIHGRTRHVRKIMKRMEDNIHHLSDDVREMVRAYRPHRDRHSDRHSDRRYVRRPDSNHRRPQPNYGQSFGIRLGSTGVYWNGSNVRFGH